VIAGYSIGCVIAYEVGLRMIERGRPVRMLLLFDGSLRAQAAQATCGRGHGLTWTLSPASWEIGPACGRRTLGDLIRRLEQGVLRHLNAGIARRLQLEDQDRSYWWEVGS